jgi:hypothetical protein
VIQGDSENSFVYLKCKGKIVLRILMGNVGWGFVALTKEHPSKISWMKWLQ